MAQLLFNARFNRAHGVVQRPRQRRLQLVETQRQFTTDFCLRIQHDQLTGGADFAQQDLRLAFILQHQLAGGRRGISTLFMWVKPRQVEHIIGIEDMSDGALDLALLGGEKQICRAQGLAHLMSHLIAHRCLAGVQQRHVIFQTGNIVLQLIEGHRQPLIAEIQVLAGVLGVVQQLM